MAGGSSEDNPVGINVTAMVDIIFCLCLFFMCSLKFKELDAKMDSWLPKDKGGKPSAVINQPLDEIRIVLSYDSEKQRLDRFFGRTPIEYSDLGDKKLIMLLREEYKNNRSIGKTDVPVIIDSGPKVPWQDVVNVMNMCRVEQIAKIEFGTGSPLAK